MPVTCKVWHCKGFTRPGGGSKFNWVHYRPASENYDEGRKRPKKGLTSKNHFKKLVFFPGDITEWHPSSAFVDYRYSIEGLLWLLSGANEDKDVMLVRPQMMVDCIYAAYVNFMLVDATGCPRWGDHEKLKEEGKLGEEDDPTFHLLGLLQQATLAVYENVDENNNIPRDISLAGFSKGCTVLVALMKFPNRDFWRYINEVHFLDAGLQSGLGFDLSVEELIALKEVLNEGFVLYLHATPRQLDDPHRPNNRDEWNTFLMRVKRSKINLKVIEYKGGQNLDTHFDSIACALCNKKEGYFAQWGLAHSN